LNKLYNGIACNYCIIKIKISFKIKTEKMILTNIQGKPSRIEMKKIMAGSGND